MPTIYVSRCTATFFLNLFEVIRCLYHPKADLTDQLRTDADIEDHGWAGYKLHTFHFVKHYLYHIMIASPFSCFIATTVFLRSHEFFFIVQMNDLLHCYDGTKLHEVQSQAGH